MSIKLLMIVSCLAFCLLTKVGHAEAPPVFVPLGDLPGGNFNSGAYGVSGDGSVVVGFGVSSASSPFEVPFRWTESTGMVELPLASGVTFPGIAYEVSGDGQVVVGSVNGLSSRAFRWTDAGGMILIGDLPGGNLLSKANAVSSDGTVIVGMGTSSLGGEAFRWNLAFGFLGLGDLPGGGFGSIAEGVSPDGAVVVGVGSAPSGSEAFRWLNGSMTGLGDLPGGITSSHAYDVSADGSVVVGYGVPGDNTQAMIWTESDGMIGIGPAATVDTFSEAHAVSNDGQRVVGRFVSPLHSGARPFLWDPVNDLRDIHSLLESTGTDLTGWFLGPAYDISADGSTIVGSGRNPNNQPEAWLVHFPPDCNENEMSDETDVASGKSADCDAIGIPDECEEDTDQDGPINACDNCPTTSNTDQQNSDGDSAGDLCDGCPNDPQKTNPGQCGCGTLDTPGNVADRDSDGIPDCIDPIARIFLVLQDADPDPGVIPPSGENISLIAQGGDVLRFEAWVEADPGIDLGAYQIGWHCSFGFTQAGVMNYNSLCFGPGCVLLSSPQIDQDHPLWALSGLQTVAFHDFGSCPLSPPLSIGSHWIQPPHFNHITTPRYLGEIQYTVSQNAKGSTKVVVRGGAPQSTVLSERPSGFHIPYLDDGVTITIQTGRCCVPDACLDDVTRWECEQAGGMFRADATCSFDFDQDGTADCFDECPFDPNKLAPGVCGCGVSDDNTDMDGLIDCIEECDTDPNKYFPGLCGCGVSDVDTDGDTVPDCNDLCPGGGDTIDTDNDGHPDCVGAPIPTTTTWGLIAMTLLLLCGAQVLVRSIRRTRE